MKLFFPFLLMMMSCNESYLDLQKIELEENADNLLKDIPYTTEELDNIKFYNIDDNSKLVRYDDMIFDDGTYFGAINGVLKGYSASTNRTATSIRLLEKLNENYGEGKLIADQGNGAKTYWWKNNDIVIGLVMPVLIFREENNKREIGGVLMVVKKDAVEELFPYQLWLLNAENLLDNED